MISLSSADREIFRGLFASKERVDIYKFHEKYLLSPGQIGNFVRRFERKRYINVHDLDVRLTPLGRRWLLKHRRQLFLLPKKRVWAKPVYVTEGKSVDPLTPYLPVLSRVDLHFFVHYRVEGSS